jgi:hypothetical protein
VLSEASCVTKVTLAYKWQVLGRVKQFSTWSLTGFPIVHVKGWNKTLCFPYFHMQTRNKSEIKAELLFLIILAFYVLATYWILPDRDAVTYSHLPSPCIIRKTATVESTEFTDKFRGKLAITFSSESSVFRLSTFLTLKI